MLSALLVDPALFTGPYDAGLSEGLDAAGVGVRWAGRPLRTGEAAELARDSIEPIYYRGVQDTAKGRGAVWKLRKAASHLLGGLRLLGLARRGRFDIVHFQWAVVPLYDASLMHRLRRRLPVILTVHDLEPFNDAPTSALQTLGFKRALQAASHIIVHTAAARQVLIDRGRAPQTVSTIAHGPLTLSAAAPPVAARDWTPGSPWRVVLFGKLQPYKGADLLVEAAGLLSPGDRARLRIVIAGEPFIPMEPLFARIAKLGLSETVEVRARRLDEAEMADLFGAADAFVFPYREIEASGVLHLVLPYGRWIIASDLGAFRELIVDGRNGARVQPGSAETLAVALAASIGRRPDADDVARVAGWDEIGLQTRAVYQQALAAHPSRRPA